MKIHRILSQSLVASACLLPCILAAQSLNLIFEDTFDAGQLDTQQWGVGTWTLGGRTQLNNQPVFVEEGGTRYVSLRFDTYNPSARGQLFSGSEIYARRYFDCGEGLVLEARVRSSESLSGIVCGFFTYNYDALELTDEIDFEYLTAQPRNNMLATSWNNWDWRTDIYLDGLTHSSELLQADGFDRGQWNVIKIVWYPDHIEWYVNDELVRSSFEATPDQMMNVRFNIWAPSIYWTDAYDSALKMESRANRNQSATFDIDYIRISEIVDDGNNGGSTPPPPPPAEEEPPAAPSNLTRSISGSTVALRWSDNSDNEEGFEIYRARRLSRNTYTEPERIAVVSPDVTHYDDQPGAAVWGYTVRAVNSAGASAMSNEVSIRVR